MEFVDKTVLWEGKIGDILKVHPKSDFNLVVELGPPKYEERKSKVQNKLRSSGANLYEEEEIPELVKKIK